MLELIYDQNDHGVVKFVVAEGEKLPHATKLTQFQSGDQTVYDNTPVCEVYYIGKTLSDKHRLLTKSQ